MNDRSPDPTPWGGETLRRLAIPVVVLAGHLSLFPRVADLDGFYHVGHAAAYLEGSLFDTSLPWATQSIIRDYGADLWWGFHVLLMPLGWLEPSAAIRVAAALLTLGLALTVFAVLRRHGVERPELWAALFLIAVPNVFYRFLMVRPHMISLAASIALISVLARGRWWHVALLAGLVSWVHLSLAWIAPALVLAYTVVRMPVEIGSEPDAEERAVPLGQAWGAAIGGALAGWLLRPEPLATASLLNVQLVQLFALKGSDVPVVFAGELSPIGPVELFNTTWLFLLFWLASAAVIGRSVVQGIVRRIGRERTTFVLTATLASIAFLGLASFSARRALVQWAAFGFLLLPFAWQWLVPRARASLLVRPLAALVVAYVAWGAWRHSVNVDRVAFDGRSLAQAATFLAENSDPGDVVFHARWDNFGPLFAWNRTNHYIGGMDPVFQFAHDTRSYWEYFYMSVDVNVEWTCDAYPCNTGVATDSHTVIRDHFGARWALVEPRRNPLLTLEFLNDPRYRLALETQREAVFEVLPDSAGMD